MNKAENAISELMEIDELTTISSPFHRLNPICKLVLCLGYILIVTSINKYDLFRLIPMVIFPLVGYQFAFIDVSTCFKKLWFILPLVMAVGVVNPFFDKNIAFYFGNVAISTGVISMITLMLKGIFSLMSSFLLVASCPLEDICTALRKLYIPELLVSLFMLTYRYIFVLLDEVSIMLQAYSLRAPKQKGIHVSAWGSFLGQLILRSFDKASRLYDSMILRGFNGHFTYKSTQKYYQYSWIVTVVVLTIMICFRIYNIAYLLGSLL